MNASLPTADRRAAADHPGAQAIADLVATGQLPQAIAAATAALANPALAADDRGALLALRFESHLMRAETAQAGANVRAMLALAGRPADAARQAQARVCESRLQRRLGDAPASLAAAQATLKAARRSGRPALVANSLVALGNAQAAAADDLPAALTHLQQAAAGFAALGDLKNHGRATNDQGGVLGGLGRAAEADQAATQALRWRGSATTCWAKATRSTCSPSTSPTRPRCSSSTSRPRPRSKPRAAWAGRWH